MPPKKKKKNYRYVRYFIISMAIVAVSALAFIGYLWWRSRQVQFVHYKEFGIAIPANYQIHGIDVSRYQQLISWEAVKEMKVNEVQLGFAFIKATEGVRTLDPFFNRNWKKAKQAGVIRGAYHYFIARKDVKAQAKNFIKSVKLEPGDLPPVLDIEKTFGLSTPALQKAVQEWLDTMEAYYGVKPIIYTYADFYEHYLQGHFDDYPLWVAHYLQMRQPRISRNWIFWQHSEQGHVNGILSRVDFNVFNGDSVAFKSLLVP